MCWPAGGMGGEGNRVQVAVVPRHQKPKVWPGDSHFQGRCGKGGEEREMLEKGMAKEGQGVGDCQELAREEGEGPEGQ